MSGYAEAQPAGRPGPLPHDSDDGRWSGHRHNPPLPVKIIAVAAAFWLFHPLGVALLVYFLWRTVRRDGGCAFRGADFGPRWDGTAWARRRGGPAFRNSAFEERRRETLKQLDEDAEAFDAFARRQQEARDREAFERFKAERSAPKGDDPHK